MSPLTFTYVLFFGAVFTVFFFFAGFAEDVFGKWKGWQSKQTKKVAAELDNSFVFLEKKKLFLLSFAPFVLAGLGYLAIGNVIGIAIGFIIGLAAPFFIVKATRSARIKKFQSQLIDTLLIMSSALKGGLSFIQAIETVCEEMPEPMSQEFGLVLKENRLGIPIEDSLNSLRRRIPLEEVNLIVTAILVARETGGELTKVFSHLVMTIRTNIKLKEKMHTLTLQGKLQGLIMSCLPFVFTYYIYKQNPGHFDIMVESPLGRNMLAIGGVLYVIGLFLIKKMSTIKI